jgi:DNA-binding LacI/PurR family transcriptional regulator
VPYREELIVNVGNWHRADGADAMRAALASGLEFDGVVAFNDSIALGAMRVLQEGGYRIPDDVAVIGFDDIELAAVVGLTTVRQPLRESGRRGAELLLAAIEGGKAPPAALEPLTVIERRTT